jgi:hypothetical protein
MSCRKILDDFDAADTEDDEEEETNSDTSSDHEHHHHVSGNQLISNYSKIIVDTINKMITRLKSEENDENSLK